MDDLSQTQVKVMRYIARHEVNKGCSVQLAGHGRAPWLSAARSLVRKGFAVPGSRTGYYGITESGRAAMIASASGVKSDGH
jgi:hypothetical protein